MDHGQSSPSKILGLDGLRGCAATMVFLTHMSNWNQHLIPGLDLGGIGRSGVLLFFILSSFLLTTQILQWNKAQLLTMNKWKGFFEARIFRIWPTYLLVLTTALITTHLYLLPGAWRWQPFLEKLPVPMSLQSFVSHIALQAGEDVLWTIPIEFKFYLLLPLLLVPLLWLFYETGARHFYLLVAAVAAIAATQFLIPPFDQQLNPWPFMDVFLMGIALAAARQILISGSPMSEWTKALLELFAWIVLCTHIALIPSIFHTIFGAPPPITDTTAHLSFSLLWAALIFCMLFGSGLMRRILEMNVFIFLGAISYDLYLWHRVGNFGLSRLEYFNKLDYVPREIRPLGMFIAVLILASMSYYLVGRPVQKWRQSRRARPAKVHASLATSGSAV